MAAQEGSENRKMFVGGVVAGISEDDLRGHFEKYGAIETVDIKTDSATGRPRGFAFVVFENGDSIDRAVADGQHAINGMELNVNRAKHRQTSKLFIGGLVPEISNQDIESHFSQFGKVSAVDEPVDKDGNRKNFCFVTFETEQAATEALANSKQTICGKEVDVKKSNPKPANGQGGGRNGGFGGGRGRGFGGQRNGGFGGQRYFDQNNSGSGGFGQRGGQGGQGNGFRNGNGGGYQGGKQRGGRGGFNQPRQQPY